MTHDAVGVNCKMGPTAEHKARASKQWAKR